MGSSPSKQSDPAFPLAVWEMRRLARSADVIRARLWLGGGLFVVLLAVILVMRPQTNEASNTPQVGEPFALAVVIVQLVGVILLAPGYGAASVAAEKERRTLETLLSTPLSHRSIILGKLFARASLIGMLVMLGLPITAIAMTLGGVEPFALLNAYAVTLATGVLLTAIGVLAGCRSGEMRGAIWRAYGWTAAYVFTLGVPCLWFASPVFLALAPFFTTGQQPAFIAGGLFSVLTQLAATVKLVRVATANLRREEDYHTAALQLPAKPILDEPPQSHDLPLDELPVTPFFAPAAQSARTLPGHWLDIDPLWWKERYVAGHLSMFRSVMGQKLTRALARAAALGAALFILAGLSASMSSYGQEAIRGRFLLLMGGTIAAVVCLTSVGMSTANAVAIERQKRTLDGLLTLPAERILVLEAKWKAAWLRGGPWLPVVGFALFMAMLGHGIALFGALFLLMFTSGLALSSFGLWASVRSETPGRAIRLVLPAIPVAAALPTAVWMISDPTGWSAWNSQLAVGLVVLAVVLRIADRWLWWDAVRWLDEGRTPTVPPASD